jgi:hypothetical protein
MHAHRLAVGDRYTRRLLTAVLEGEEAEVREVGDINGSGSADPEDSTHF